MQGLLAGCLVVVVADVEKHGPLIRLVPFEFRLHNVQLHRCRLLLAPRLFSVAPSGSWEYLLRCVFGIGGLAVITRLL